MIYLRRPHPETPENDSDLYVAVEREGIEIRQGMGAMGQQSPWDFIYIRQEDLPKLEEAIAKAKELS